MSFKGDTFQSTTGSTSENIVVSTLFIFLVAKESPQKHAIQEDVNWGWYKLDGTRSHGLRWCLRSCTNVLLPNPLNEGRVGRRFFAFLKRGGADVDQMIRIITTCRL